jgi:hypothetical protein
MSKKIGKNFGVSFSSFFFGFIAFSGVFQRQEFKNTTKKICKKNRVEKFLQKVRPQIQNRLFLDFFPHVFGRFLMRGVQKHVKKINIKKKSDTGLFTYSDPPTHHGGHRFVFWRPLAQAGTHTWGLARGAAKTKMTKATYICRSAKTKVVTYFILF